MGRPEQIAATVLGCVRTPPLGHRTRHSRQRRPNGLMTSAPRGASPNGYWVLVTVPLPLAFDTRSASVGHDPFGCEKPGQLPRLLSSRKGQSTKSGDLRDWALSHDMGISTPTRPR